jgi:hypothetical protein
MRLTADWSLPRVPAPPGPQSVAVEREDEESSATDISSLALLEGGSAAVARAAAQVVCDQLRRCAHTGRLPQSASGATARSLRERLSRTGFVEDELEEGARLALASFDACLADPRLQWIFSPAHGSAEGPYRLSGFSGGCLTTVSVDRTFMDEAGVRWLILFEAADVQAPRGAKEPERQRLEKAFELARALEPHPVRAGIYDTVTRRLRELD